MSMVIVLFVSLLVTMTTMVQPNCNICSQRILAHSYKLQCNICFSYCHLNCISCVDRNDSIYVNRDSNHWMCVHCAMSTFPFNHFCDDDEFIESLVGDHYHLDNCNKMFQLFDCEESCFSPMYDIDPDIQYHQASSIFSNTTCNYYLEDDFNRECIQRNVNSDCFSILHVNAKSG